MTTKKKHAGGRPRKPGEHQQVTIRLPKWMLAWLRDHQGGRIGLWLEEAARMRLAAEEEQQGK